jgi:hypothetical protein
MPVTMPGANSDTDDLLLSDDAAMPAARSVPRKRPAPKSAPENIAESRFTDSQQAKANMPKRARRPLA